MCGICGLLNLRESNAKVDIETLHSMCGTLYHRGPDDEGFYAKGPVGLGMRRLSIIDVKGGHQPIGNENGTIWTVFNGEVYNYRELRSSLESKGHQFSTNSDTECIVHSYEEFGLDFVSCLRGMFAFALWDENQRKLILGRDRFGIKPLFYGEYDGKLFFASEMKAILKDKLFPREIDDVAIAAYFTLSYIPAPLTIFSNIRKLLPGHILIAQDGQIRTQEYWDIQFKPDRTKKEGYFIEGFMSLLRESVAMHLMSEVPLGAFLSGGIDSSLIVALMSQASTTPITTITVGFGGHVGGYLDERTYAREVARQYRTYHKEHEVLADFVKLIERIVQAFDEPHGDDSVIPSYFVCKVGKEDVTVALSGLGGDEFFCGYERYLGFALSTIYERIPFLIREKLIRKIVEKLPERPDGHYTVNHMKRFVRSGSLRKDRRYFGYLSYINQQGNIFSEPHRFVEAINACEEMFLSYFNAPNAEDALDRAVYCDIKTYLPEDILAVTDRMSMSNSLEVRVPFLDHKFAEFCATIPSEMKMRWFKKKYLLRKAATNLLPREVFVHRKQGFVGPMAAWLRTDLKPYVLETVSEKNLRKHGLFNWRTVERLLKDHFDRREIYDTLIWSLIVFQIWYERYVETT